MTRSMVDGRRIFGVVFHILKGKQLRIHHSDSEWSFPTKKVKRVKRMKLWWTWFDLIVLFYIDSLNKTRNLFYNKVHEAKKTLIKDINPVNRAHLTGLMLYAR